MASESRAYLRLQTQAIIFIGHYILETQLRHVSSEGLFSRVVSQAHIPHCSSRYHCTRNTSRFRTNILQPNFYTTVTA